MFFFFNDTATTEIYTLSLHDALPICEGSSERFHGARHGKHQQPYGQPGARSEEHTSELQSRLHLVCRLLLEKKKCQTIQCPLTADSTSNALASTPTHTLCSSSTGRTS